MMNRVLLLSVVFLFVSFAGYTQGYRGKRFSFSYKPSYNVASGSWPLRYWIYYHDVDLGFALSDHWSVNVRGMYGTHKMQPVNGFYDAEINDLTVGLSFSYFRKQMQSFAPVGKYIRFGLDYGKQNSAREVDGISVYDGFERIDLIIPSVTFGRNFLIKEWLLFGYGLQTGWCFGDPEKRSPKARQLFKPHFNIGIIF